MTDRRWVQSWLETLRPDGAEVPDKVTLDWVGRWARATGVVARLVWLGRVLGPSTLLVRGATDV